MTKRSRQALYVFAGCYFVALAGATAVWSVRHDVAQFFTLEWFGDVATRMWSIGSADLLSAVIALELVGLVVLGYVWWLGDMRQRTWPPIIRKIAPLRQLLAVLVFPVYVLINPVTFLVAYAGLRENMTGRGADRRKFQDPAYTGPERRLGSARRTIERRAFAGHPRFHAA